MSDVMADYSGVMLDWRALTSEYESAVLEAAQVDADYKLAYAREYVVQKHRDPKLASGMLDALVIASDGVQNLIASKLVTAAQVEAIKKKLEWHRARADHLRTQVVNDREENKLGSQAGAGPGRTTFEGRDRPPQHNGQPQREWTPPPQSDDDAPADDWRPPGDPVMY